MSNFGAGIPNKDLIAVFDPADPSCFPTYRSTSVNTKTGAWRGISGSAALTHRLAKGDTGASSGYSWQEGVMLFQNMNPSATGATMTELTGNPQSGISGSRNYIGYGPTVGGPGTNGAPASLRFSGENGGQAAVSSSTFPFDGQSMYGQMPHGNYEGGPFPFSTGAAFSMAIWVKQFSPEGESNPTRGGYSRNCYGVAGQGSASWGLDFAFNSQYRWYTRNGTDGFQSTGTPSSVLAKLSSGNTAVWHLIVGVNDNTDATYGRRIYYNGELVNSGSYTHTANFNTSNARFWLGKSSAAGGGNPTTLIGDIGQLFVYNKALTTSEVNQVFQATRERYNV
tara:strand:+ start:146 stop:1159 length:1014 start_codon:yes stop_codon:yes gene_type:complete